MIEVEIKLPVRSTPEKSIGEQLLSMGFQKGKQIRETDVYFDGEDQRIRKQGEALRIREIYHFADGTAESVITYKGKKLDTISMTRQELESGIEDAAICTQLLCALGFHPVEPRVIKLREHYHRDDLTGCVDHVEGLGEFLELEVVIPEGESKETALGRIQEVLKSLGYSLEDTVRDSYLSMLQGISDE